MLQLGTVNILKMAVLPDGFVNVSRAVAILIWLKSMLLCVELCGM